MCVLVAYGSLLYVAAMNHANDNAISDRQRAMRALLPCVAGQIALEDEAVLLDLLEALISQQDSAHLLLLRAVGANIP